MEGVARSCCGVASSCPSHRRWVDCQCHGTKRAHAPACFQKHICCIVLELVSHDVPHWGLRMGSNVRRCRVWESHSTSQRVADIGYGRWSLIVSGLVRFRNFAGGRELPQATVVVLSEGLPKLSLASSLLSELVCAPGIYSMRLSWAGAPHALLCVSAPLWFHVSGPSPAQSSEAVDPGQHTGRLVPWLPRLLGEGSASTPLNGHAHVPRGLVDRTTDIVLYCGFASDDRCQGRGHPALVLVLPAAPALASARACLEYSCRSLLIRARIVWKSAAAAIGEPLFAISLVLVAVRSTTMGADALHLAVALVQTHSVLHLGIVQYEVPHRLFMSEALASWLSCALLHSL